MHASVLGWEHPRAYLPMDITQDADTLPFALCLLPSVFRKLFLKSSDPVLILCIVSCKFSSSLGTWKAILPYYLHLGKKTKHGLESGDLVWNLG